MSIQRMFSHIRHWFSITKNWSVVTLIPILLLVLFFVTACGGKMLGGMFGGK